MLEVGLGGRLDATNLIDADVAVLASVGLDHRDWLGDTLELIGAEKAGIFRAQRPAVLGTPRHARERVRGDRGTRRAGGGGRARLQLAAGTRTGWDYRGLKVALTGLPPSALAGAIQYRNAATALAALEALDAVPAAPVARLQRVLAPLDGGERRAGAAQRAPRRALPDRAGRGGVDPGHRAQRAGRAGARRAAARACAAAGRARRGTHHRRDRGARRQGCRRDRRGAAGGDRSLDRVRAARCRAAAARRRSPRAWAARAVR